MLRIEIHTSPEANVLRCSGRLVLGIETETLRSLVMSRSERNLVLDMRDVHVMDATGLGTLVELHCWAKSRGWVLQIANPSPRVQRLINLTKLHAVLQIARLDCAHLRDNPHSQEPRAMTA